MKKEWFLKVLFVCGFICAGLFLFTMHSSAQFSYNPYGYQQPYQQSYNSYGSGMTYDPRDLAIMAAGGMPSWVEIPDWTERPYPYGGYQQPYNPYGYQQPSYGYQQPYNPYGYQQPSYGYQQPYNPYGYQQPYNPYGYQQPYNPNNPYVYPYADQAPYGYQPPLSPYGYYQGGSLANDMVGPYGYPGFSNPYAMYGDTRYFQ